MHNPLVVACFTDNPDTTTTNGAGAYSTTLNPVLDLFFRGGAVRGLKDTEVESLVTAAFKACPIDTLRVLAYLRDVRQGVGERDFFRKALKIIYNIHPKSISVLAPYISFYGRWDDAIECLPLEAYLPVLAYRLVLDCCIAGYSITFGDKTVEAFNVETASALQRSSERPSMSLLAKWLPSVNASNYHTRSLARALAFRLGLSYKEYRKMCSFLREKLNLVENNLRTKDYSSIDYEHIPSMAMLKYRKAFARNDKERFEEYLKAVKSGEKKMNTGTMTPFDIVHRILELPCRVDGSYHPDETLAVAWDGLKNIIGPEGQSVLCVCDTSGSMFEENDAIDVALSLTLYFCERNKGLWEDCFFTFSEHPQLVRLPKGDIFTRLAALEKADWGGSTDIEAVFNCILNAAIGHKLTAADLPSTVVIISDMQFNDACGCQDWAGYSHQPLTIMQSIKHKYAQAGYPVPKLVFWNANAKEGNYPVTADESGAVLVSGRSANIFNALATAPDSISPEGFMRMVLDTPRYSMLSY